VEQENPNIRITRRSGWVKCHRFSKVSPVLPNLLWDAAGGTHHELIGDPLDETVNSIDDRGNIAVIYEELCEDPYIVRPVTAYDVPEYGEAD